MEKFIGRERELELLDGCLTSGRSEFVIIYGRRRIGKTFLVRYFFKDKFTFSFTGRHHFKKNEQLSRFAEALRTYSGAQFSTGLANWYEAFAQLKNYLSSLPSEKRKVVFFDEMPWIDAPKSDFVKALEEFWNCWAALRDDIFFIACGSSTSWMVDKLMENQGGMHNRITRLIYLRPMNLHETEEYFKARKCTWSRYQILQCYMTFGGVPYYLSLLDVKKSLVQNIDELFFHKNSQMRSEYDELYNALFKQADKYISVMKLLSRRREGFTRQEIIRETKFDAKTTARILVNLERSDFIISYVNFGHKVKDTLYRIIDFYTLFYYRFVEGNSTRDEAFWANSINTPSINAWQGFTFELICLCHLPNIKKALGISGINTSASSWHNENAQIDMLIDRADGMINLCEMKFSTTPFAISKEYSDNLRKKEAFFQMAAKTRKGLLCTLITTYGVMPGRHNDIVQAELTMDALFN